MGAGRSLKKNSGSLELSGFNQRETLTKKLDYLSLSQLIRTGPEKTGKSRNRCVVRNLLNPIHRYPGV